MTDIFISYSTADKAVALKLADALRVRGWNVFVDRRIAPGAEWNQEIQQAIKAARCVVVLWSPRSINSLWVQGEAAFAFERNKYLPVSLEDNSIPRLFQHIQGYSLAEWSRGTNEQQFEQFYEKLSSQFGPLTMYGNLETVADGGPVTVNHLHLIHSCWRVNKSSSFGFMPYQIHVILYGHKSALDRVVSVEYRLPEYPAGHDKMVSKARDRLFELKQLANGWTILQAHVTLDRQPVGHPQVIKLSRFINMGDHGPRLFGNYAESFAP